MKTALISRPLLGRIIGILFFFLALLLPRPEGMTPDAQKVIAVTLLMAIWWITEALPIPATALLPLLLFPLLNLSSAREVAQQYGDRNIFLFMGGFFLAVATERWNLHKRLALYTISIFGTHPRRIILGMMIATAFLSMWISNTATAVMMMPIALAVIHHAESLAGKEVEDNTLFHNFSIALLFGIGYSASIGGIGTLIGTPPNIIFAAQVKSLFPEAPDISFFQWFMVGFPLVLIFLPITWFYLVRIAVPVRIKNLPGGRDIIRSGIKALGPMQRGEKFVLWVFLLTAFSWMFRKTITLGAFSIPGWSNLLGIQDKVHDSTVAIGAAILLFFLPVSLKKPVFLLDWEHAKKIPWGILLLFGGGLALAHEFQASHLAQWVGTKMTLLQGIPILAAVIIVIFTIDFLTEVTSNTAITSIFMPVLAAMSIGMGIHPYLMMIAGTIAASLAFMLPVATPPNAVIFGSGYLTIPKMAKTGIGLNFLGMIITTAVIYALAIPIFNITLHHLPLWAH